MATKSSEQSTVDTGEGFKPFETTTGVKFVSAGLAASVAEIVTMPIDTSKVRLQVYSIQIFCRSTFKTNLRDTISCRTRLSFSNMKITADVAINAHQLMFIEYKLRHFSPTWLDRTQFIVVPCKSP